MLSQEQILKQQQTLSPQQIQAMKIVELPVQQLEERVRQELDENPALEEGKEDNPVEQLQEDDYSDTEVEGNEEVDWTQYIDDDEEPEYRQHAQNGVPEIGGADIPFSVGESFHELLMDQLHLQPLTSRQLQLAETVIGNIDERGYLTRSAEQMADDLAFTQNIDCTDREMEEMIRLVQTFDPAGIGARDLRECLLLQLKRKQKTPAVEAATEIVESMFDDFSHRRFEPILMRTGLSEDELREAMGEIVKLTPQPGGSISGNIYETNTIVPDLEVDDNLDVHLLNENIPSLRISRSCSDFIKDVTSNKANQTKENRDTLTYYKKRIDDARWFIDAIRQRDTTLRRVMEDIVRKQRPFFRSGDESLLRPMILKDVAESTGYDISTISRASNSKYVNTEYGIFPLKFFFSESMATDDGDEVSTRQVKQALAELVAGEDKRHPLTDEKLVDLLREQGFVIARRTVAKYRGVMGVPVASQRREV